MQQPSEIQVEGTQRPACGAASPKHHSWVQGLWGRWQQPWGPDLLALQSQGPGSPKGHGKEPPAGPQALCDGPAGEQWSLTLTPARRRVGLLTRTGRTVSAFKTLRSYVKGLSGDGWATVGALLQCSMAPSLVPQRWGEGEDTAAGLPQGR